MLQPGSWSLALAAALLSTPTASAGSAAITVTAAARSIQPGEVVLLTITGPDPNAPVSVHAFDRDWRTFAGARQTSRALIGIDLDVRPGRHRVSIAAGDARTTYDLVVKARSFRTRRLTVDPNLVNPPAEALERIGRETRDLERAWAASSDARLWEGPFVRPVEDAANSAFGTRSFYNGEARSAHGGADFASAAGTPIASPNAGRVVLAGARYFTGGTVVIDHGLGLFSLFAHLARIDVTMGEMVRPGTIVGSVGATGRVTGPHLHWAVRLNGARVDPLSLLFVTRGTLAGAPPIPSRHP
jgi:murein DD-endopeptidase MepM/ murein hydrolase activator NlpD